MADYTLPDLPYDYSALEPHVSGRIMELHHDKHHAAYVTNLNNLIKGTEFDVVTVEGHTDRLGSSAYNQRLSTQRAEAVKAYLVSSGGIPGTKVSAIGKGKTMPVTKAADCAGSKPTPKLIACLQPDRRVVVEVTGTR